MSYTTEQISIQTTVWNFLRNKGLSETATAGAMGNVSQESSWDVTEIEAGNGIGFGLFQWSFERRTQLEAYGTDLTHQLEFLWSELTGENTVTTGAQKQWINASGFVYETYYSGGYGASDSASAFCWCWERPAAQYANVSYRDSEATYFLGEFTGTVVTPPSDGGGGTTGTGTVKLKNKHLYNFTDSLFGRKIQTNSKTFTLVSTLGDMCVVKDGEKSYNVPKKNIINS